MVILTAATHQSDSLAWWQTLVTGGVGALIGGVFSLGGVWLTVRHQSRTAKEGREAEQAQVFAVRREAYELTQLDQLDMAVQRFWLAMFAYVKVPGPLPPVIASTTPEGVEYWAARGDLVSEKKRTLDSEIRDLVDRCVGLSRAAMTAEEPDAFVQVVIAKDDARDAISDRIRKLYAPDQS